MMRSRYIFLKLEIIIVMTWDYLNITINMNEGLFARK